MTTWPGSRLRRPTADGVEADLNAIENDLNQMKDEQGDLNEGRTQEVE